MQAGQLCCRSSLEEEEEEEEEDDDDDDDDDRYHVFQPVKGQVLTTSWVDIDTNSIVFLCISMLLLFLCKFTISTLLQKLIILTLIVILRLYKTSSIE